MNLPNIYSKEVSDTLVKRISNLNSNQVANWGKMDVAQMLAHCNVTYDMAFDQNFKKSSPFIRFILKNMVKKGFVNLNPLKKNSSTAPEMLIKTPKNFEEEKSKIIANIQKVSNVGEVFFDGKDHPGFGIMTGQEWNNFYFKHLDHHLTQFGV
jgi:ribosomal protein S8